jgi:hypothetical protein
MFLPGMIVVLVAVEAVSQPSFRLTVLVDAQGSMGPAVTVVARSEQDETEVRGTLAGRSAVVALPSAGRWSITCQGKGVWCPSSSADIRAGESTLQLPLFPASTLTARLLPAPGTSLPPNIVVQTRASIKKSVLEATAHARLQDGRVTVSVPRAPIDLRLAVPGFIPVYQWAIDARRNVDLGRIELRRGGSVSGYVFDPSRSRPSERTQVRLTSPPSGDTFKPDVDRMDPASTYSDARGFFQLAGIKPGLYRLELLKAGHPPTTIEPVEVQGDAETALDRIDLVLPANLDVEVSPATDPDGRPWDVALAAVGTSAPLKKRAGNDGRARFEGLTPGEYTLIVLTASGARLLLEQIDVTADRTVSAELPLVRVKGKLSLGDKPLSATVQLATGSGDETQFTSDAEGAFGGWMRRPSRQFLLASVKCRDPLVDRRIDISEPPIHDEIMEVDIRLDNRRVTGQVVDDQGRGIPGARVRAEAVAADLVETASDANGRFDLDTLQPRRYHVWAADAERSSAAVELDATPPNLPDITLVFSGRREINGIVLSSEGYPVSGAAVEVIPAGAAPSGFRKATDSQGQFKETLGTDVNHVVLVVMAPSQHLWSGCMAVPEEGPLTVRLPATPGGSLDLRTGPADATQPPVRGQRIVLFNQERGFFDSNVLYSWSLETTGLGERIVDGQYSEPLPRMAPGGYAAVWSAAPAWVLAAQTCSSGPPSDLSWTMVPAGGQATLVIEKPHRN